MKYFLLVSTPIFWIFNLHAQKSEAFFDYSFKPSNYSRYYYVVTEKQDSLWHREAYFVSQRSLAMEGWYKDDNCQIPHGIVSWYHTTKFLKSKGIYNNGKKTGIWKQYDKDGFLIDSSQYENNRLKGAGFKWYPDGMLSDSLNFDGEGNGVQLSWYNSGKLSAAGYWTQDTVKTGKWRYFDEEGVMMAEEEYTDGRLTRCNCFDEKGQKIDSVNCLEKEAMPKGGIDGWQQYMAKSLKPVIESQIKSGVKPGIYTIIISFIINKDGSLGNFSASTAYGNGMEDSVIAMLKKAPKWTPAKVHGRSVKSFHMQPVSFNISN